MTCFDIFKVVLEPAKSKCKVSISLFKGSSHILEMYMVDKKNELNLFFQELMYFVPVDETTFGQFGMFSAMPEVILENGWFNNVTVMRGYNKDEASPSWGKRITLKV